MKKPDKIDHITPELMEAYLNGNLDNASMHQVERLMLESGFEEEAMEGMAMLDEETRSEDITMLRGALKERSRQKRSFPWWGIAAAIAILAISGYFVANLNQENGAEPSLAGQEESVAPADVQPTDTSDMIALNRDEENEGRILQEPALKEEEASAKEESAAETDRRIAPAGETEPTVVSADEADEAVAADVEIMLKKAPAAPQPAVAKAPDTNMDTIRRPDNVAFRRPETDNSLVGKIKGEEIPLSSMDGRTIRGRIIMQDGTPLPGVNVLIDGTSKGTISDIEGYYQIEAPSDASIVFSMLGMEEQAYASPKDGELNVTMEQDDATLSEVVVTGRASPELRASRGAEPSVGQEAFQEYIRKALRYPEGGDKEGSVIIRITVDFDGSVKDMKVIRSLGEAFDLEALRLIREGPSWNPAYSDGQAIEDHVRVKIDFSRGN